MKIEVYPDKAGAYRWRLRASSGRIMAVSGESFARKGNARRAGLRMQHLLNTGRSLFKQVQLVVL